MAVRKFKGSWWVDFRVDYARYRKRSPENSRAGAAAYEATLRQRLARGENIDRPPVAANDNELLFARFAREWFELYVIPNNKPSEQYAKQKILEACLIPALGNLSLASITTEHVERLKTRLKASGVSNKTINNRLTVLSKCLRCAHEWRGTPMPTVKLLRCVPPKIDYLTPQECEALLEHTDGQLREMVFLALRTGMRQGEIRGLQWSSIDWQTQSIAVRHSRCDRSKRLETPKNHRERYIPLDVDLRAMLYRRMRQDGYVFANADEDEPFTSHRALADLGKACASAGIRKVGWHVLRHTFATQLTLRGTPMTVVKELLGHSSITTTMRYAHVTPAALRAAIGSLNPRAQVAEFGQPVGNPEPAELKWAA